MINRKLIERITEKWHVKVLSLAAALIIMIFYRMNTLETRFFSVPLLVLQNDRYVTYNAYDQNIRVSLRGEASVINAIIEDDIEVYIDLGEYKSEGNYRVPVKIKRQGSAFGVDSMEVTVNPAVISVRLEEKAKKEIPLAPVLSGTVAEGFELSGQIIYPAFVTAEGPRSSLDSIYAFNTNPIDLEGRFDDFSVIVGIKNDDPLITIHGMQTAEYRGNINAKIIYEAVQVVLDPENIETEIIFEDEGEAEVEDEL